jgi:competence protein ComEC
LAVAACGTLLLAERERWILWLPVGVGAGAAIYFALPNESPWWAGVFCLIGAVAIGFLGRKQSAVLLLAVALGAGGVGFFAAQWRTAAVASPVLAKRVGPATIEGRVLWVEARPGGGQRILLERVRIASIAEAKTPRRIRLTNRVDGPGIFPGDRISVRAVAMRPPSPAAPGAYDFPRRAWFQGLGAVGFTVSAPRLVIPEGGIRRETLATRIAALRQSMSQRIRTAIGGDAGAVAAALMTGDRGAISEEVLTAMRDPGLAHLLAISGLHVGLLAGVLFFFVRGVLALIEPVALRYPIKKWAAVVAIGGAFLYLLATGATIPTQRAFVMTGIVLAAILLDRAAIRMRLVAFAALIILIAAPETILGPSFQMSFAAVVALIAVYELRGERYAAWRVRGGIRRTLIVYGGGILLTTMVASLATTPFAVFHFNRFVYFGLAANLVAVPITALWIMPWATVAYVLMPFGLEALALAPMGWGVDLMLWVARTVAGWPGAVALLPALPVWALALTASGGLWLCQWRQRWRYFGAAGIVAGMAVLLTYQGPDILIDGDAKQIAVRAEDGGLRVSGRRTSFVAETWLRRDGLGEALRWPTRRTPVGDALRCDALGCVAQISGRIVALAQSPDALAEDCRQADIVVSVVPVRGPCPSARLVIDRFDVWRQGAHAIWLTRNGPVVRTAAQSRGNRPWVETARRLERLRRP